MESTLDYERKKLNSGIFYSTIKYGVNIISGLAYSVLIARLFGAELVGMFFLLMTFIGVFNIVTNLGEQGGLVRMANKYKQQDQGVTALLALFFLTSLLFTLILMLPFGLIVQQLLTNVYHKPHLILPFWILCLSYTFFNNTSAILNSIFVAFQEMKYSLILEVILTAIKILGVLAAYVLVGKSVMAVVLIQVLIDLSQLVLLLAFLGKIINLTFTFSTELFRQAARDLKEVLLFGLRLMPKNYNYLITEYIDRSLIPVFITSISLLGLYVTSYQIFSKIVAFSAVFCKMLFPSFSRLSLQSNTDDMLTLYRDSIQKLSILMVFIVALGAGFAKLIMGAFGPEFTQAGVLLMLLLPGLLAEVFSVSSSTLLQALDRPGLVSLYSFAGAGVNALLNISLIPVLGIEGAALSNTLALILMAICFYAHACKVVGQNLLNTDQVLMQLKLLAIGGFLFLFSTLIQETPLPVPALWIPVWAVILLFIYLILIHTFNIYNLHPLLVKLQERTKQWQRALP